MYSGYCSPFVSFLLLTTRFKITLKTTSCTIINSPSSKVDDTRFLFSIVKSCFYEEKEPTITSPIIIKVKNLIFYRNEIATYL